MEDEQYHGRLFLIGISFIVIVVFVILIGIVLTVLKSRSTSPQQSTTDSSQTVSGNKGQMNLSTKDGLRTYRQTDAVTIVVSIDSAGEVVSGYDVDLSHNDGATFVKAESLIPDFTVSATAKQGNVIVTGYKKLTTRDAPLSKVNVVALTFRLNKSGKVTFTPLLTVGRTNESNVINTQNKNILGTAEGMEITVN